MKSSKFNLNYYLTIVCMLFSSLLPAQGLVSWNGNNDIVINENSVSPVSTGFVEWERGAVTTNQLQGSTDGYISYKFNGLNGGSAGFGFSESNANAGTFSNINYCFTIEGENLFIYESGAFVGSFDGCEEGDSLSIEKNTALINFYKNGELLYESPVDETIALWGEVSFGSTNGTFSGLLSSFETPISATASIDHVSCMSRETGNIQLTISGGFPPYQVIWDNGQFGTQISNLEEGVYTATIIDAENQTVTQQFTVAHEAVWDEIVGLSVYQGEISAVSNGTAKSDNRLLPYSEGWLTHKVDSQYLNGEMVGMGWGLTKTKSPLSFGAIKYAFVVFHNNNLAIYVDGVLAGTFGAISDEDELKIAKVNINSQYHIQFLKNGELLHEAAALGGDEMVIKMDMPAGKTSNLPYSSFGCGTFSIDLLAADSMEVAIIGAGLDESHSGVPFIELKPTTPSVGLTDEIQLRMAPLGTTNYVDLFFEIDHSSRISHLYTKETDPETGQIVNIPVDPKFFRFAHTRGLVLQQIPLIRGWGGANIGSPCLNFPGYAGPPNGNWSYTIAYGDLNKKGDNKTYKESITYFDGLGRDIQSQTKNNTDRRILANAKIVDEFGRTVLQTLPAPLGNQCTFFHHPNFITNSSGQRYSYLDFDVNDGTSQGNKIDNPNPVHFQSPLGLYYSNSNYYEGYVATSDFPYSRVKTTIGQVSVSSQPGDKLRMGAGHEHKSRTFPVLTELDHYISFRGNPNVGNIPDNTATTLKYKAFKVVSTDPDGDQHVSFIDLSGNQLASCKVGNTGGVTQGVTGETNSELGYIDIHLPPGKESTLVFTTNTSTPIKIWDLADNRDNPVPVFGDPVIGTAASAFSGGLAPGFYRIVVVDLNDQVGISYELNYYNFAYNYYDKKGELIAEVQPEGIVYGNSTIAPEFITTASYHGWFTMSSSSVDEGLTEFVYKKDGEIRFSQDAHQRTTGSFSYISYDETSGRVIEIGEYTPTGSQGDIVFENYLTAPSANSVHTIVDQVNGLDPAKCHDQVYSHYDLADPGLKAELISSGISPTKYEQKFLLGTASYTMNENTKTWYSYDMHGRLDWTIQKVNGVGLYIIDYAYNFQGNLLQTKYNEDFPRDAVFHRYTYDRDNRLLRTEFSTDGILWEEQVEYEYYLHGPLKREEIAEDLQGIDLAYTIDGRLKAINHPSLTAYDPGKDGFSGANQGFGKDVFGMSLDYFEGDYVRSNTHLEERFNFGGSAAAQEQFGGLIAAQRWNTRGHEAAGSNQHIYQYLYDDRFQLTEANYGHMLPGQNSTQVESYTSSQDYRVWNINYDRNGNLTSLNRDAHGSNRNMDRLTYNYSSTKPNRLISLTDASGNAGFEDISTVQMVYDEVGRMTEHFGDDITITYNAYSEIEEVFERSTNTLKLSFTYDDGGNRLSKKDHLTNKTTWYIRDAGGSIMGIYDEGETQEGEHIISYFDQTEVPIYGATRVGVYYRMMASNPYRYELSDHLGNIRAVINGEKDANGNVVLDTYTDFYPFGWSMPGRYSQGANRYRFGYQGIEHDPETGWNAFALRNYDPRMGRWFNPDPYGQHYSPYLAMGNNPVSMIDPDGGWDIGFDLGTGMAALANVVGDMFGDYVWKDVPSPTDINFPISNTLGSIPIVGDILQKAFPVVGVGVMKDVGIVLVANFARRAARMTKMAAQFVEENKDLVRDIGLDLVQELFATIGSSEIPIIATIADGIDGGISWSRDDKLGAALSWGGAIAPGLSQIKLAKTTARLGKRVDQLITAYRKFRKKYKDGPCDLNCFPAGTLIQTADSLIHIEDIKAGDMVWAYREETGEHVLQPVVRTVSREAHRLVKLFVQDSDHILVTPEHPFFINGAWTDACIIAAGDSLTTLSGYALVDSVALLDTFLVVYNFEVDVDHTYFIGESGIVAHNCPHEIAREITQKWENFDCVPCAKELASALKKKGHSGEIIELGTTAPGGVIGSAAKNYGQISTNGRHVGVLVDGKIYDNIHKDGISFDKWIKDFEGPGGSPLKVVGRTSF